jgi:hypothetical protein
VFSLNKEVYVLAVVTTVVSIEGLLLRPMGGQKGKRGMEKFCRMGQFTCVSGLFDRAEVRTITIL